MFIQKVIHVRRGIEETKATLSKVHGYRSALQGVKKAFISADGVAQFDLVLAEGFSAHFVLAMLPAPEAHQVLFHSTAGNVEISGLIEFSEIRENFTEVQITLDYSFTSLLHRAYDAISGMTEKFLDCQLQSIEAAIEAMPIASEQEPASRMAHLPRLVA